MKKILKKIAVALLIVFIGMQFYRVDKNTSTYEEAFQVFEQETAPPTEVVAVLKDNCYDCHSNHTNYPWYAEIAPVSYWLDDHVSHGKGDFNVSKWETYSVKKKAHKLEELAEEVEEGHMPLDSYTWIHGSLTDEEKELVINWAKYAKVQYDNALNPVE